MFPRLRQHLFRVGLTMAALLSLAAVAISSPGSKPASAPGKLVVHEWGTFLGVQGSDGSTLGGMVASEESLPPFVEARSFDTWDRVTLRSKMETPVTYFYTDKPMTAHVRVDMPNGILTHWYPMVAGFGPPLDKPAPKSLANGTGSPKGSYLAWENIELVPHTPNGTIEAGKLVPTLWRVKAGDPWRFARDTDSAIVRVRSRTMMDWAEHDFEKFLFYRGLGAFELPLQVRSSEVDGDLQLTLLNRDRHALTKMFLISVQNGEIRFGAIGNMPGNATSTLNTATAYTLKAPVEEGVHPAMRHVAQALKASGLYEKEAWAMVNSWKKSYFQTEGLRVLFVLPRETVDAYIPIQINPKPQELVRVMVGRTEIMTPAQERQVESWIQDLGSPDFRTREAASTGLAKLGRLSEPALRRIAAVTSSAEVRNRADQLIRAAIRTQ